MHTVIPWFTEIANYLVAGVTPSHFTRAQIEKLKSYSKYYVLDDPCLWKFYSDQMIRHCVLDFEFESILSFVIVMHMVDTLVPNVQLGRYWTVVFIGLPYFEMLMSFADYVSNVRE